MTRFFLSVFVLNWRLYITPNSDACVRTLLSLEIGKETVSPISSAVSTGRIFPDFQPYFWMFNI